MPYNATALLPAGLVAGDIPNLRPEDQAIAGFFSRIRNEKTARLYKHDLKVYLSWCAEQNVDILNVHPVQVELYLRWLQQSDLAESTISRRFGVVATFYRRAVRDRLITWDPTADIERPEVDYEKQHRTWLSPLELARFLEVAQSHGPHVYAIFMILGHCGLRAAEVCSLRIEHMVRLRGEDTIRFVGKGNLAAKADLPMAVSRAVDLAIAGRTEGPIILNTEGNPYTPNSLWRLTKRLAVEAGIDPAKVSVHTFRRSCARIAILVGEPVHKVQAMLRHKSADTTLKCYIGADGLGRSSSHNVSGFLEGMAG
ncbi:MAG: 31, gp31 [Frankiales bacterium]|nr:31, gp31 [Frankiales bacterium]